MAGDLDQSTMLRWTRDLSGAFVESEMKEVPPIRHPIGFWEVRENPAYHLENNEHMQIQLDVDHIFRKIRRTFDLTDSPVERESSRDSGRIFCEIG
jgi:hypothetical protein